MIDRDRDVLYQRSFASSNDPGKGIAVIVVGSSVSTNSKSLILQLFIHDICIGTRASRYHSEAAGTSPSCSTGLTILKQRFSSLNGRSPCFRGLQNRPSLVCYSLFIHRIKQAGPLGYIPTVQSY